MLDGTSDKPEDLAIKQVEINTIASSFGGLSSQMGGLHKYFAFLLHYLILKDSKYMSIFINLYMVA